MKRRGVSPIIAVLLLIIIAVAAAVVTYGFVMGFIGGATTTTATTQAIIRVEAVELTANGNNKNVTVYVRNVGSIPVNVTAVYVYSANGTLVGANTTLASLINPGDVSGIKTWINLANMPVGAYYVKVVTKEGAIATSDVFSKR